MSTPPFLHLPPTARAHHLPTARGAFAVLDSGPAPGQPLRGTAVLVPGFTGSKEDFITLLAPLAARGYRVVAVDQRGQYETPGPDGDGSATAYSRDALVDDLAAVCDAVRDGGARPHLLGHSFGGLVARSLALRDAAHPAVASLTLMSTGPAAIQQSEVDRLLLLETALASLSPHDVWLAMNEGGNAHPDPAIARFLEARWMGNAAAATAAFARQLRTEPDRTQELARVVADGFPALVLSGEEDYAWPVPWQAQVAQVLGVRHVVVAGAGHSPAVDDPKSTAAALADFWDGVAAAGQAHPTEA